jgi:hypothetical protein
MRSLSTVTAMLVLLLTAGIASAQPIQGPFSKSSQPTLYVCTADAYVLKVEGNTVSKVARGTGAFGSCTFGPDGWLYIASGKQIVRVDALASSTKLLTPSLVTTLSANARSFAFNVNTLYITTDAGGVFTLAGTAGVPLTFSGSPQPLFAGSFTGGRGITFQITGTLAFVANNKVQQSIYTTSYQAPTALTPSADWSPFGLAVNTCGDIVVADTATRSLRRYAKPTFALDPSPVVGLSSTDVPLEVKVDTSNRHYVLVADDTTGLNPRIARVDPRRDSTKPDRGREWLTSCGAGEFETPVLLPDLKVKRAVGLAVGPSAHRLTWDPSECDGNPLEFDFGYHKMSYEFPKCQLVPITVDAYETLPSAVRFASTFPAGSHPFAFSPVGGLAVEYALSPESGVDLIVEGKYSYYTQEAIGKPGVGRSDGHTVGPNGDIYDQNHQHDYWDVGELDAMSGNDRGDGFSKRVLFSSPVANSFLSASTPFVEPQNPLFNNPQTIPITIEVAGAACANLTIRVSVVRIDGTSVETQNVTSNVQTDNNMEWQNDCRYRYVMNAGTLNTTGATAATPAFFIVTLWGDMTPHNLRFYVAK